MDLRRRLFGASFQNPVLLAAGTCGFGMELADVVELDALGGFVTKSVTLEPRDGNPAPRVAEFGAGMVNSIGLANPGVEGTRREKLPWIRAHVRRARVFVSVAGHREEEYARVVEGLDGEEGFLGFELNLSCPNDERRQGRPFSLDPDALGRVVRRVRGITDRPLLAKLAPDDPGIAETARAAEEAGADGLTLVNTLPGLVLDDEDGEAALGAGPGGVSGPGLRPVGVRAVREARGATSIPVVGVGGILNAGHALQYLRAGASLVQVGTASFADPRAAERIVRGLERRGRRRGAADLDALTGGTPPSRGEPAAASAAGREGP